MGIPIGTSFTSTVRGRAVKTVACEKCYAAYVYAVDRSAKGSGFSLLFLDNQGARNRAAHAATKALQVELTKAVDPIACPKCEWYQADMVKEARRRRGKWLFILALIVGGLGAFIALTAYLSQVGDRGPWYSQGTAPIWNVAFILLLVAVACLVVRRLTCTKWDPNADTKWKSRRRPVEAKNVMTKADYDRLAAQSNGASRA